ncbi:non-heme chloroperoxidase [Planifilum fulgidum]|uniref:Non-heme chloroperoxidase n=1 Tax=Planifilum fulgidum TaxID=201973 RepID=A0A1I2RVA1_9BACL|nr:alpha/beta hydrolase [Planifilum fulgidum]MBO2496066.1 alpha/beta hydrolase [Bacillota bacterium]MBO2533383.1 alpha/beta hydrolase [Thermoactinomycetaceae bacterium]SFG41686.1 non-heme chloroperoxidase [Planifilum fulgidum]
MGYFVCVEPGVSLYVEDLNPAGKKTLVFLHGWPFSHEQFEYQFNVLPAKGYRLIGIDWRGFGRSDKPVHGYHYNRLADDVLAVVDALGLDDFTLVGHSTGGAIAVRYAARHRGRGLSKLVLMDAAAPAGFTKETADRLLAASLNDRPKMVREVIDDFFFQYISRPFSDWFFRLALQAAGWSTAAIIRTLRDERLDADLPRIHVPTLIVHGIHDKVIPFSQAEELSRRIDRSRLVPFLYSGHGPFWEERDKMNRLLMKFVG